MFSSRVRSLKQSFALAFLSLSLLLTGATLSEAQIQTFAGNPQHTNSYPVTAQTLNATHWTASVNDQNTGISAHYGQPLVTPGNTVIVMIVANATSARIEARNGSTGALKYSLSTDYVFPTSTWIPTYQPVVANGPNGKRLYYPGAGGKVYYVDNIDSNTPTTPNTLCFYGLSNYNSNPPKYNDTVFINSPLTADSNGNIEFGFKICKNSYATISTGATSATQTFDTTSGMAAGDTIHFYGSDSVRTISTVVNSTTVLLSSSVTTADHEGANFVEPAPTPFHLSPSGFGVGGYARISSSLQYTYQTVDNITSDADVVFTELNAAPAFSNDEASTYVAAYTWNSESYILRLNSTTLSLMSKVVIQDPRHSPAWLLGFTSIGTASPMVGPDGDVYWGVGSDSQSTLLHYSGDLSVTKNFGGFGWDFTPGVVPASLVPSYHGTSSYLLFAKYNNYGMNGADGANKIAILDPNDETEISPTGLPQMRVVESAISPTPGYDGIRPMTEWCVNAVAVDPSLNSIYSVNEDGKAYRWNLLNNSLAQALTLSNGFGQPYTPQAVGPDGQVYVVNGSYLHALGEPTGVTITLNSSLPDMTTLVQGTSVTFTANLMSGCTGTVTFQDSYYNDHTLVTNTLGTVNVSNSAASITTAALAANMTGTSLIFGDHFIKATYSGDANHPSASVTRVQKVHSNASTVAATVNPTPTLYGQPLTLGATVYSYPLFAGTPTWLVSFIDTSNGNRSVAQGPLDANGAFNCISTNLSPGTHAIVAAYQGDMMFAASTSPPVNAVIQGITTLSVTPSSVRGGTSATGTVNLATAAGVGGAVVNILSDSPNATVPPTVTVPQGATSANFTITTSNSSSAIASAQITCTYGNSKSTILTVLPNNQASFVSQSCPSTMSGGYTYPVNVVYANIGTTTWTTAAGYALQSLNPDDNTRWGMNRLPMTATTVPGQNGTFAATITAPTTPGTYDFRWSPIEDSIGLRFGSASPTIVVTVSANSADDAAFISQSGVPTSITHGASFTATITMRNVGLNTWAAGGSYRLKSQNPLGNTTWGTSSITSLFPVSPGSSVTFSRTFTAPATPGSYHFQWRMDHNGTAFGQFSTDVLIFVN